jgi:sterol desaturase/sphingolipid hydroxylase (fatty acid hydroxylase superfamily)
MKDFASAMKAGAIIAALGLLGIAALYLLKGNAAFALIDTKARAFLFSPGVWTGAIIGIGVMIVVLALEIFVLGWDKSGLKRILRQPSHSARIDIFFAILYVTRTLPFFQVFFTLGLSIGVSKLTTALLGPSSNLRLTIAPETPAGMALAVFGLWLVFTFNDYWWHRLMHQPLFWPLHRMHHTATELSVFSQFRDNPGNAILTKFYIVLPVIFFNISPEVLTVYTVVGTVNGSLTHCELPWGFGLLGRWLVCSPIAHQIHHSAEPEHYNANFSFLPLWDRLFGTWYAGEKKATIFGVADEHFETMPLIESTWADLREFYWNFPARAGLVRERKAETT